MRKILLFLLFCSPCIVGYAQINAYDRGGYAKFSLPSFDEMAKVAQYKQQQYNQNAQYLDALITWIFDLKQQTNDVNFNKTMDAYYNTLKSFYDKDLSVMGGQIKHIELRIKEDISKYNNTIEKQSISYSQNYSASNSYSQSQIPSAQYVQNYEEEGPVIVTKLNGTLRAEPSAASKALLSLPPQLRLKFLSKEGEYYKVQCGQMVGYINEMWISE